MIDKIDNEDFAKILKRNSLCGGNRVELKVKYLEELDIIRKCWDSYLIYQKNNALFFGVKVVVKGQRTNNVTFVGNKIRKIFYRL